MKKQKIILIVIFLTLISTSCKHRLLKETSDLEKKITVENLTSNSKEDTTSTTVAINNDEFIFGVLDNELSISNLKTHFKLRETEILQNRHDPSVHDSVIIFSNGKDTASFYVSPSNVILQAATINSQEIILHNTIKVGASNEIVKRKFNLKAVPDSLIITDFENSSFFLLIFQQGRINKIVYEARYID